MARSIDIHRNISSILFCNYNSSDAIPVEEIKGSGEIVGVDVNKSGKSSIPEMGGLAALIGRRRYIFSCLLGTAIAL